MAHRCRTLLQMLGKESVFNCNDKHRSEPLHCAVFTEAGDGCLTSQTTAQVTHILFRVSVV